MSDYHIYSINYPGHSFNLGADGGGCLFKVGSYYFPNIFQYFSKDIFREKQNKGKQVYFASTRQNKVQH